MTDPSPSHFGVANAVYADPAPAQANTPELRVAVVAVAAAADAGSNIRPHYVDSSDSGVAAVAGSVLTANCSAAGPVEHSQIQTQVGQVALCEPLRRKQTKTGTAAGVFVHYAFLGGFLEAQAGLCSRSKSQVYADSHAKVIAFVAGLLSGSSAVAAHRCPAAAAQ